MPQNKRYADWLKSALLNEESIGIPDLVLTAVMRITTHPGLFANPLTIEMALSFCAEILSRPNVLRIAPGPRHWAIFTDLCLHAGARGNLVQDAYLAALAIEQDAEWVSADTDFARFPALKWRRLA